MRIDVHVHLTPPYLLDDRKDALRGEPALELLYGDESARMSGTPELLASMDGGRVDMALVGGFPFRGEQGALRFNSWILEECARHPDRLLGMAAFDPRAPFAEKHARWFLEQGGFGLGELCVYDQGLTDPVLDRLEALMSIASERGAPVLVHVNEPVGHSYPGKAPMEIRQIDSLVRRSRGARLVLAHFGGGLPFFAALKRQMKESLATVRFDTAAMPFLYDPSALKAAAGFLGAGSFLYGSDYPLLGPGRYEKYFREAGLTGEETDLVFGEAAGDFLGLRGPLRASVPAAASGPVRASGPAGASGPVVATGPVMASGPDGDLEPAEESEASA
ncbi:MAG: amidohydrolase family protein [Deltaproteobacteria bacterium]|jgi:predicted TIM-barrel fold metal-dependent hydrolase|nr:amidohydrolase family protein [Deltaproteobacteria bacterium]